MPEPQHTSWVGRHHHLTPPLVGGRSGREEVNKSLSKDMDLCLMERPDLTGGGVGTNRGPACITLTPHGGVGAYDGGV